MARGGHMASPVIAIVGDANPKRQFDPPKKDPAKARKAAEDIGQELAKRGAGLVVYGGPFIEADVVCGFVRGNPAEDRLHREVVYERGRATGLSRRKHPPIPSSSIRVLRRGLTGKCADVSF